MKNRSRAGVGVLAGISLFVGLGSSAYTQALAPVLGAAQKGRVMTARAIGTFDVELSPQAPEDKAEGTTLGRMSIEKQLHGDLEGTSNGQMLTAVTGVEGSAGYVAIERVSGKLRGRSGTFVLQHSATMTRGVPQLTISVVPDSGTGQLVGLTGKMTIKIEGGKHSYDFEYTLAETP
jgi:hypothetical protein